MIIIFGFFFVSFVFFFFDWTFGKATSHFIHFTYVHLACLLPPASCLFFSSSLVLRLSNKFDQLHPFKFQHHQLPYSTPGFAQEHKSTFPIRSFPPALEPCWFPRPLGAVRPSPDMNEVGTVHSLPMLYQYDSKERLSISTTVQQQLLPINPAINLHQPASIYINLHQPASYIDPWQVIIVILLLHWDIVACMYCKYTSSDKEKISVHRHPYLRDLADRGKGVQADLLPIDPAACCKGKSSFLFHEWSSHEINFSLWWARSEELSMPDLCRSQHGYIWALPYLYSHLKAPSSAGFSSNLPQMVSPSYRVWLQSRKSRRTRWSACLPRIESTESQILQFQVTSYFHSPYHPLFLFTLPVRTSNAVLCVSSTAFEMVHPTSYSDCCQCLLGRIIPR